MVFWISRVILLVFTKLYLRGKVYGKENLPENGPYIGVINHNSNMDVVAMSLVATRKAYTMAKDSLFRVPVLKWWLKAVGMFPVVRDASDHKAFNYAVDLLRQGKILYIAPEGTRKKQNGQRNRPRTGFVRMAQLADCPIVPIAMSGTDKVLPPCAWFPRRVKVSAIVGKPFKLEPLALKKECKDELQSQADWVMDKVYEMVAELETR
ncbi:MAG: lysophospholipid acyltransferase family protein [Candidatus Zhuqueibacterota bacterium]